MLGESWHLEHGMVLKLYTPSGKELLVRRRGSTAAGEFFVRQKKGSLYVEYRYFERGSGFPKKIYIGTLVGIR